jgi:hypothetical protein
MKILFLCGHLEPGRSGVGDYIRKLSNELSSHGHTCALLALRDPFVPKMEVQRISEGVVPELRLSSKLSWNKTVVHSKSWIYSWNPDIVSFQFVNYSYGQKGILWRVLPHLLKIARYKKTHVMFHEIWIGERKSATMKHKLLGCLQASSLKALIEFLNPTCVHTSNLIYSQCLEKWGIRAKVLPMFSTIPIISTSNTNRIFTKLGIPNEKIEEYLIFGFFGTIHTEWPLEPLYSYLDAWCAKHGKKMIWVSLGHLGEGEKIWVQVEKKLNERALRMSNLEQGDISILLQEMNFGIATTPWQIIGKSTSAAAFVEHGLPTIVNREELYGLPADAQIHDQLFIRMDGQFESKLDQAKKQRPHSRLTEVAEQFVRDLETSF